MSSIKKNKQQSIIKLCTELDLPYDPATQLKAYKIAKSKNRRNIPEANIVSPVHLALVRAKFHKPGSTLKVKFLNGTTKQKEKVKTLAKEWEKYASIKFDFVTAGDSDIRIGFKWKGDTGSWSYIGTDVFNISQSRPTMNFGWLDTEGKDEVEYRRTVIHEFGHTLGCIHEHQNPSTDIKWDKPKVYAYYQRTNGWDKETVDSNIFEKYSSSRTQFSQFDKKSIMLYSIPNELTLDDFEVGRNTTLSDIDKSFIGVVYPLNKLPMNDILDIGETYEAEIGEFGEEDYYEFELKQDAAERIIIETKGSTDVVMSLMDSTETVIAWDDDSGQSLNAKISKILNKGKYFVRVRHYSSKAVGKYTISLKRA